MNTHNIKHFSIYGLFGRSDVHIPFEENVKILVGENGIGKTQILNIFYYTLTTNFLKLKQFPFDKIELKFDNVNELIEIEKTKINESKSINDGDNPRYIHISPEEVYQKGYEGYTKVFEERKSEREMEMEINTQLLEKCETKIKENLSKNDILYFPTFRRIEKDLHNLGYVKDKKNLLLKKEATSLINFGMDDVQKRFKDIQEKIDLLMKKGFTEISSEILSKLVKGFGDIDTNILDKINETDIEIILARVGNQISDEEKSKIREIVLNKKISDKDNSFVYFMQILINIYEKQRKFDDSINNFKEVCNNYLIDKKVFYDESNIEIYLKSDHNNERLELNRLSSGEKQIISIFSKIYLSEDDQRFIVLFDEPELSLSMIWQKQLLPDILKSGKCNFLLAVTHSPFIFDNELDKYAMSLSEYIKPLELQKV